MPLLSGAGSAATLLRKMTQRKIPMWVELEALFSGESWWLSMVRCRRVISRSYGLMSLGDVKLLESFALWQHESCPLPPAEDEVGRKGLSQTPKHSPEAVILLSHDFSSSQTWTVEACLKRRGIGDRSESDLESCKFQAKASGTAPGVNGDLWSLGYASETAITCSVFTQTR